MEVHVLRAVGRSENPGVPVLFGGHNLPPLDEIGLTDLAKTEGHGPPCSPDFDGPVNNTKQLSY